MRVNARGTHGSVRERQVGVARISVVQKMSYAEAVKRILVSRIRPIDIDRNNMCFSNCVS